MNKRLYLLVFDRNPAYDYMRLHNAIKNSRNIIDWWHYIQSAYILVSTLSANDLANEMMAAFPNHRFFLSEINGSNHQGWLPKDAWGWINKHR